MKLEYEKTIEFKHDPYITTDDGGCSLGFDIDLNSIDVPGRKSSTERNLMLEFRSSDYPEHEDIGEEPIHPEFEELFKKGKKLKVTFSIEEIKDITTFVYETDNQPTTEYVIEHNLGSSDISITYYNENYVQVYPIPFLTGVNKSDPNVLHLRYSGEINPAYIHVRKEDEAV